MTTNNDNKNNNNDTTSSSTTNTIFPMWSRCMEGGHELICSALVSMSMWAGKHPKITLVGIPVFSLFMVVVGFFTNFELVLSVQEGFAPFNAIAVQHREWIEENMVESDRSLILMIVHVNDEDDESNNNNIVGMEGIKRVFTAVDTVRNTTGYYEDVCGSPTKSHLDLDACDILSVGSFWDHNYTYFYQDIQSDRDVARALMWPTFRNGMPVDLNNYVDLKSIEAVPQGSNRIEDAKAYFVYISLPTTDETENFLDKATKNLLELRHEWATEANSIFRLEVRAETVSMKDEMNRAIIDDLPLIPVVVFLMSAFTCIVFFKCDKVESRMLLGVGSCSSIAFSIMSGFGLLFMIGVPYTNMSTLLPFIVFGVGLDDTFIITGHYLRTDRRRDPLERLAETIATVGMSIFVTTLTTSLAFILGLISNIPAIYWLCLYAFPTIMFVFIYQLTFFVAILMLDERRVMANRADVSFCFAQQKDIKLVDESEQSKPTNLDQNPEEGIEVTASDVEGLSPTIRKNNTKSIQDRFMIWYSDQLMRPWVKALVIFVFGGILAACIYSTTELRQAFDPVDLVPESSYLRVFALTWEELNPRPFPIEVYFRNVDQSNPDIQEQMIQYMDDLAELPYFNGESKFCWIKDWEELTQFVPGDLDFYEKLDVILSIPHLNKLYGRYIIRDPESGNITESFCDFYVDQLNRHSILDQIDFLHDQRQVTLEQPINFGRDPDEWSFFAYHNIFAMYEFYALHVSELIATMIAGLVAVTLVTLLCLPHWSAVAFVTPTMMVLYIDLIGTIQFCGLDMNVVTFVILVISIGLLVDFVLHVLFAYYESTAETREGKAKEALRTLGPSILLGGISTLLGVVPLAFSTSTIIQTVFVCFIGMILLGVSHGLIVLPVLLSLFGPVPKNTTQAVLEASKSIETKESKDVIHTMLSNDLSESKKSRVLEASKTIETQESMDMIHTMASHDTNSIAAASLLDDVSGREDYNSQAPNSFESKDLESTLSNDAKELYTTAAPVLGSSGFEEDNREAPETADKQETKDANSIPSSDTNELTNKKAVISEPVASDCEEATSKASKTITTQESKDMESITSNDASELSDDVAVLDVTEPEEEDSSKASRPIATKEIKDMETVPSNESEMNGSDISCEEDNIKAFTTLETEESTDLENIPSDVDTTEDTHELKNMENIPSNVGNELEKASLISSFGSEEDGIKAAIETQESKDIESIPSNDADSAAVSTPEASGCEE